MNIVCCFEHTLIKVTGKIKVLHEIGLVYDHLEHIKRLLVTNQESLELSLNTFKPMCGTTFETPWGKVQNLLGMKLTTDVTLLFLSAVNNIYLFCFFMSQVWTMKSTESTNICYVSDTVACTIKMNVKQTFLRNDSFRKCFCGEWTAIRE